MQHERINVADVIDGSAVGGFQIRLFVLCALCLIMDGFDVQVIGFVAPEITREWNVAPSALGPVLGAGNFGVLIGALLFTMVADKIGRRPVLVWSTLFFSVMMLLTAMASSVEQLLALRFVTGIGLGSVIPNATALIGEYSPKRLRVTLMMSITVGFTAGAAFGGFIAAWLIPLFGWRSVFQFGGAVPLVIALLMWVWLPESMQILILRKKATEAARRYLRQVNPAASVGDGELVVTEESREGVPASHLFRDGRMAGTLLLWFANFMNILLIYSLSGWMPTVARGAGYPTSTAVLAGTVLQVGGTLGTWAFAWLIARLTFIPVLVGSFFVACLSIAIVGWSLGTPTTLMVVMFVAGWCTIGAQPGLNALSATFYPTYLRSTGVGWGLGIGRIGAIVGPIIGGQLLAQQWTPTALFYVAAIPAAAAAVGTLALKWAIPTETR
jgi:MFS transporter, AAHS family, 4-hydroxybenzoate transporter